MTSSGNSTTRTAVPAYSWAVLIMLYLAAAAAPLNMFKVASLAPQLIGSGIVPGGPDVGILMSSFNIAGLILAIPGGILVQKLGIKTTLCIALGFVAVGSVVGSFASEGAFNLLLGTRFLEGIGFGLLGVSVPSGIAVWFPKDRRGVPLGVFTTWVPFGMLIMLVIAPLLYNSFQSTVAAWWFGAIFSIIILIVIIVGFKMPNKEQYFKLHGEEVSGEGASKEEALATFKSSFKTLKNGKIWVLAIVFTIFNAQSAGGTVNFLPTFMQDPVAGHGLSLETSDWLTAVAMIGVCVCEPFCGWLSDKIGSRKKIIFIPLFGLVVTSVFIFNPSLSIPVLMLVMILYVSLFSSGVSTGVYAAAPELAGKPEYAGMANGMVAVGQNIGLIAGPLVFSNVLVAVNGSWTDLAYFWLIPAALVGGIIALFIKSR